MGACAAGQDSSRRTPRPLTAQFAGVALPPTRPDGFACVPARNPERYRTNEPQNGVAPDRRHDAQQHQEHQISSVRSLHLKMLSRGVHVPLEHAGCRPPLSQWSDVREGGGATSG